MERRYTKGESFPVALATTAYGFSNWESDTRLVMCLVNLAAEHLRVLGNEL